jgi:uncharacterized protein YgiM (DUF1202 family)
VKLSQRGAISLPIVIAAVLGLGFGASAYLNYAQYQRAEQDKKLLKGQITDLRYQVDLDKKASPSPSPSASPSPSPSTSPTPVLDASTTAKTASLKTQANLHSGPSPKTATLIHLLPAGTSVTLGSDLSNGYQQITVNGKTGYVVASYLQY